MSWKPRAREVGWLARETVKDWMKDKTSRLGAALAYYTAFSLAPLLVISVGVAGLVLGEEAVSGHLHAQLAGLLGPDGATAVEDMVAHARKPATGVLSVALGAAMLLVGAGGVFGQLQDSLNTIWGVTPRPGRGLWGIVRARFLSFAMVLGSGFLLLVSLLLATAVAALGEALVSMAPVLAAAAAVLQGLASIGVTTVLFAAIFKVLPDARIRWRDVWIGAAVTAVLFEVGKSVLGLYLGRSAVASSYGAAGSVLVVLLWVYYASQILFLGAEFTKVWAVRRGSWVRPVEGAIPVSDAARADQGIPLRSRGAGTAPASRDRAPTASNTTRRHHG